MQIKYFLLIIIKYFENQMKLLYNQIKEQENFK